MKPPINTFEDLVASEDVKLIVLADTVTKQQIMASFVNEPFYYHYSVSVFSLHLKFNSIFKDATRGAQKILGNEIRRNPDRMLNTLEEVTVRLKTKHYAFGTVSCSVVANFLSRNQHEKPKLYARIYSFSPNLTATTSSQNSFRKMGSVVSKQPTHIR